MVEVDNPNSPYSLGESAFYRGKELADNEFKRGTFEFDEWETGYKEARSFYNFINKMSVDYEC